MNHTLFLQSDTPDPYPFYQRRLRSNPVFWDAALDLWAVYSYAGCQALLSHPAALIPAIPDLAPTGNGNKPTGEDGRGSGDNITGKPLIIKSLSGKFLAVKSNLARLSNPPHHTAARQIADLLFQNMRPAGLPALLDPLLGTLNPGVSFDWVDRVCKVLPVIRLLMAFSFNREDCIFITSRIAALIKIMQPVNTPVQAADLDNVFAEVYTRMEGHIRQDVFLQQVVSRLAKTLPLDREAILDSCIGNMIGLLIQSYDAGRGALSNVLLYALRNQRYRSFFSGAPQSPARFVLETLRYDSPVQHTRRIAGEDIYLDDQIIKRGQTVLLVLASANRDPRQFADPSAFDPGRANNRDLLTFGYGAHACLAARFAVSLATDTLSYLIRTYPNLQLCGQDIRWEPLINMRLPEKILVRPG